MRCGRRPSFALMVLLAACGGPDGAQAVDTSLPIVAAPSPAPGDTACPATGLWARCSVIRSLERAGFNTHADSAKDVTEPVLSVPGFALPMARGEVRVFLYADSASRIRDRAKLDPAKFVLPQREPFNRERTIVESANLLVLAEVFVSRNRERIANALMAGPPQPPSKKP